MRAYLDTHVAVWLHDGLIDRFSAAAKREIEENQLLLSPMVMLEFRYLYERKRLGVEPIELYTILNSSFGIDLCDFPFAAVAMAAMSIDWSSDPFDRLIVGQAVANHDAPLITADVRIRHHYPRAVW